MNNIEIENDRQNCHHIYGITVKTPNNSKISKVLMEKVIESLNNQNNAILEHVNGNGRILSLLCSSLAWQEHQKIKYQNFYKLQKRIVYASQYNLKYLENQLKKTDYKPKITYFQQEDNIENQNEDQLIIIQYGNLLNTDLTIFQNSIMILDDFDQVQDIRIFEKIQNITIEIAVNELDELITQLQMKNEQDQQQYLLDFDLESIKFVQESIQYLLNKLHQIQDDKIEKQDLIYDFLEISILNNNCSHIYDESAVFDKYLKTCEKISNLPNKKQFSLWFKFIKQAIFCYKEKQKYQNNNFSIKITNKNITILVKYYLQYLLDTLKRINFHSIIISSNTFFSNFASLQFKLVLNRTKNIKNIINCTSKGVLLIFSSFKKIKQFKVFCKKQKSDFFDQIGKYKKLFWGLEKNEMQDYIQCSKNGAILFDSYQRIFNRSFHFPGPLCQLLILVELKTINYHRYDQQQYENDEMYYLSRCFNTIVGRSLLNENDQGVLLIFTQYKQKYKWEQCLQDVFPYSCTINEYEQELKKLIQNDYYSQNDVMSIKYYFKKQFRKYPQKFKKEAKKKSLKFWNKYKQKQLLIKSQKIKKQKNENEQTQRKSKQNKKQQRYIKNKECEDQMNQLQQQQSQNKQENFIQYNNDLPEKRLDNKNEQGKKKKKESKNKNEKDVTPKKNEIDVDPKNENKQQYQQKDPSIQQSAEKNSEKQSQI
ncbi:unnamed protein product [Paramecium pentaurelia]|uniref:Uncharacterized protein n=1 Tax=Paramecium pentaurelia TaxID=43138 RepID=A0A8S1UTY1_9CILI|nr:unnamed protein product [Paramecium pentaurelia]